MSGEKLSGEKFLEQLNIVRTRARFLPVRHPSVQESIETTHGMLRQLLAGSKGITLIIRGGEFFLNGRRMPRESLRFAGMVEAFEGLQIHSLQFLPGLTPEDLTRFIDTAFVPDAKWGDPALQGQPAPVRQFSGLRINEEDIAQKPAHMPAGGGTVMAYARETYGNAIDTTIQNMDDTFSGGTVNVQLTMRVVDMLQDGILDYADAFFALSQLRDFSEYTYFHSVNVAIISMLLGKGIGLDREAVSRLGLAAMLHDLGKVFVPPEILDKPGRLDEKERSVMETHPLDSVRILLDQRDVAPAAIAVAAEHHAGFDMNGYPKFSGIGQLHLFSHICTIADVYDALRSARSYKPGMLPDKSMEILLEGSGKTFHPTLLKAFFRMVGFYPVGSAVELDTGELAIVASLNPLAPMQPKVQIVPDVGDAKKGRLVNLVDVDDQGFAFRSVLRAVDPADYQLNVVEHLNFAEAM